MLSLSKGKGRNLIFAWFNKKEKKKRGREGGKKGGRKEGPLLTPGTRVRSPGVYT